MEEINDIPQTIRDQIGSGKVIATIDLINERADIARLDLVPQLVYDVISKDVPAKDFVSHCSKQLKFGEKKLKAVVREIKEKILKQFDYALLNYGVDIKEIDVSDAMTLDEWIKQHNEMLASVGIEVEKPVSTISLESFSDTVPENLGPVKINVSGVTDETPKKIEVTDEPAPLVIHREKPQISGQERSSSQQTKGFSLPFGFFKQKVVSTQGPSAPVRATIEFLKNDKPKRAVNYSELRTPLTPFSKKEEGFIQMEKTQNPNSQFQIKSEIQNLKTETKNTQTQPIIQKINPLARFGGNETTHIPKVPEQVSRNTSGEMKNTYPTVKTADGILDIRGTKIEDKQKTITDNNITDKKEAFPKPKGPDTKPMITDVSKNTEKPTTIDAPKPSLTQEAQKPPTQSARPPVGQGPTQGSQTPPPSKSFSVPEKPKTSAQGGPASGWPTAPVINTTPKQNTPIEQKKEHAVPPTSGRGFVWFKKPIQKTITMTDNNNTEKNPRVEGNTIDLRSTNNENNK